MNLDKQLTNLELSKKLKELRVKQDGLWSWFKECSSAHWIIVDRIDLAKYKNVDSEWCSAFTVAECLEIYGEEIVIPKGLTNIADFIAKKILDKVEDLCKKS